MKNTGVGNDFMEGIIAEVKDGIAEKISSKLLSPNDKMNMYCISPKIRGFVMRGISIHVSEGNWFAHVSIRQNLKYDRA